MNRRRTWVIISVLWFIGVMLVSNPLNLIMTRPLRFEILGYAVQYSNVPPKNELRKTLIDFLARQRDKNPDAAWVKSPGSIEEKVDEVIENYRSPPLPWVPLLAIALIAFSVPAVILVLGNLVRSRRRST